MGYWTNKGKSDLIAGGIAAREFRIVLVKTPPASQAAAADLNFLSEVTSAECDFTNYARKTLASVVSVEDDTNDRAALDAADPSTYTAAGGATNNTIAGAWIVRRSVNGADTPAADLLWMFLDVTDLPTNGGDVTLAFNATGLATIT
ncbi:MAG: hypothetical protein JWM93_3965 [Frankiales bacterium]|nr:hypothetical protein [Frankiales bacterium]